MAVTCAHCGEELMGSVNRCWRCGKEFSARAGDVSEPPLRRSPIPLEMVAVEAQVAEEEATEISAEAIEAQPVDARPVDGDRPATQPVSAEDLQQATEKGTTSIRRVGSPFADPPTAAFADGANSETLATQAAPTQPVYIGAVSAAAPDVPVEAHYPIAQPSYPTNTAAAGGSFAALALGVMSLIAAFFTTGAVITALIGLGMGIWGLYSNRRSPAIIGLFLCCIAIAFSGYNGVVYWYEERYGHSPWETDVEEAITDDSFQTPR